MSSSAPSRAEKLFICETCIRDRSLAANERSLGRRLADAVRAGRPDDALFELRIVSCLSGCLRPANVALRCRGKFGLRFSRLTPDDADAVLDVAARYCRSADGRLDSAALPERLAGKLSATIPPGAAASPRPTT